jgi:hypothetical protein
MSSSEKCAFQVSPPFGWAGEARYMALFAKVHRPRDEKAPQSPVAVLVI